MTRSKLFSALLLSALALPAAACGSDDADDAREDAAESLQGPANNDDLVEARQEVAEERAEGDTAGVREALEDVSGAEMREAERLNQGSGDSIAP